MASPLSDPPVVSKLWQPTSGSTAATEAGHGTFRNAGVSYEPTFAPPTITLLLPAAEKYAAPRLETRFAAFAIGPFWKNGSFGYARSSTMTFAWLMTRNLTI